MCPISTIVYYCTRDTPENDTKRHKATRDQHTRERRGDSDGRRRDDKREMPGRRLSGIPKKSILIPHTQGSEREVRADILPPNELHQIIRTTSRSRKGETQIPQHRAPARPATNRRQNSMDHDRNLQRQIPRGATIDTRRHRRTVE